MTALSQDHYLNNANLKVALQSLLTDITAVRAVLGGALSGSATWDVGSLIDAAGETSASIPVTGAALGDFVLVSAPVDLVGMLVTGYVDAANSVKIRVQNESGSTADLASGTWRVRVLPQATFAAPAAIGTTIA
jgi:hypothetical protein